MMATARLRSQMMGLTDAAANRIKSVIGVNRGCQEVDIP